MNVALRKPQMSREQFLDWASAREDRSEFDGFQPVAMTGGTIDHTVIALNIHRALYDRLRAPDAAHSARMPSLRPWMTRSATRMPA